MSSGSGNISLSRAHGRDYAGPGAGACTAIVHVLAYSALVLSSKFVLDDLRFPYPLFLAAVGSLGAPWLCLVSGETADVELQDACITGTKLNSVSGILLDGTISAIVSGLATTGLLFLDPISWGVVMANLPVFHIAMTIGTRNAKRILLVCRAGRGARDNVPGDDRAVVEGAAAGVLDHLAEQDRTRDAKIKNGRGTARGPAATSYGTTQLGFQPGPGPGGTRSGTSASASATGHQRNSNVTSTVVIIEREHSKGAKWARLTEPVQVFCIIIGSVGSVSSCAYGSYDFVASSRTASALDLPARGVPLAAFGILFCVPALLVASLRDVLQIQEAEHEEHVELEPPRSAISAGALVLGAGATGAVRKSAAAAAFSNDKGEVDSEQEDVDDNYYSDADNNGGLSGAGLIATCTDAARQQLLFRSEFCSMCVQSICLIACAADLEGVEAGHALLTFTTTSTARTAIIEPGSLLPMIALCALLTGVVRLLSDELRRCSDGDKGGNPSLMPLPWLGYCSVVVIMVARLVCFGGVRDRAQRIAGPVVLSETQMAFTFCMLAAALWLFLTKRQDNAYRNLRGDGTDHERDATASLGAHEGPTSATANGPSSPEEREGALPSTEVEISRATRSSRRSARRAILLTGSALLSVVALVFLRHDHRAGEIDVSTHGSRRGRGHTEKQDKIPDPTKAAAHQVVRVPPLQPPSPTSTSEEPAPAVAGSGPSLSPRRGNRSLDEQRTHHRFRLRGTKLFSDELAPDERKNTGAVGPPVKENTKKKPNAMKGRAEDVDVHTPTANELQSVADLCPNEKTTLQRDISERIVPEENVFLVAPSCPIEYIKGYRSTLFPNTPRVTCFDHAAADKSIDLISDFLENQDAVTFFDNASDDSNAMRTSTTTTLRNAYRNLNPRAFRADVWRVAILYYCGGLYMDAKFGIPHTGQSKQELAAAGGVFATFLRPNRKALVKDEATSIRGSEGNGNGTHGPPRPESGVEYRFASGEVGLCLGRWSRDAVPDQWRFQNNVLASYPRNPTLLYILREQMENVAREDYRKGVLGITGPDAFVAALQRHECHRRTIVPRCMWLSPEFGMSDIFSVHGEKAREELRCFTSRDENAGTGSEPCHDGDTAYVMLSQQLQTDYVQQQQKSSEEELLCSHARLLQDLGSRMDVVDESGSTISLKNRLTRALDNGIRSSPDKMLGSLLVGQTEKWHDSMHHGGTANSQGGEKLCEPYYASLFGRKKVYCSNLIGGEHGEEDDCNVACKDNHN